MKDRELNQIKLALAVFAGAVLDRDGYCGCPKCGSRNLLHDGSSLDDSHLLCSDCWYGIGTSDPYVAIYLWNKEDRTAFQLEIQFE